MQWMHQLFNNLIHAIGNDLIFPSLTHDGLRWEATWNLLNHEGLSQQRKQYLKSMPEVVGFRSEEELMNFQNHLVDASCRQILQYSNWKPQLPRKRSPHIKSLRNICTALSETSGYFITDTINIDNALLELSSNLQYEKLHAETGTKFSCQMRLLPNDKDEPWKMIFEAYISTSPNNIATWKDLLHDTRLIAEFGLTDHLDALRSFMSETIDLISSSVPGLEITKKLP